MVQAAGYSLVEPSGPSSRVLRKPQHKFFLQNRPWQLQPICLIPVLPGETMKNLLIQSRVVSDPLKSQLLGWWLEYFFFYVKISDLDQDAYMPGITNLFLDPLFDKTPYAMTSDAEMQYRNDGIPWLQQCIHIVRDEYFRDPGDTVVHSIGEHHIAAVNDENFMNSLHLSSEVAQADIDVDLNADTTITTSEIDKAMRLYQNLLMGGLVEMSYPDFLATYGIKIPDMGQSGGAQKKPELIRYIRDWTYPTVNVNASTGAPTSAAFWSVSERADKARFFREPGFIFGLQVVRPKVNFANQWALASNYLDNMFSWLPAVMASDPKTSIRKFAPTTGPLNLASEYVLDMKDLFLYGESYYNIISTSIGQGKVALPKVSGAVADRSYATATDADGFFKTATVHSFLSDGIVSVNIAGQQRDTTPTD